MNGTGRKLKISFNSPVILWFSIICLIALIAGEVTRGMTTTMFFSVYHSSLLDPFTYVRFVGHVFGHANLEHFLGNITLLLVIGPMIEEKYGSVRCVIVDKTFQCMHFILLRKISVRQTPLPDT